MTKQDYEIQFDEFLDKLGNMANKQLATMNLTLDFIETEVGFPVKEIQVHIHKEDILEEFKPYLGNKLCDPFIIGSAFPTSSGWKLTDVKGKTIFTACGFNVLETLNFQSFIFEHKDGQAYIEMVSSNHVVDTENYYCHIVECTEELVTAMDSHSTNKGKKLS
jgi:hypothetical protein